MKRFLKVDDNLPQLSRNCTLYTAGYHMFKPQIWRM